MEITLGQRISFRTDGCTYQGYRLNGIRHGEGTLATSNPNVKYQGSWSQGKPNGKVFHTKVRGLVGIRLNPTTKANGRMANDMVKVSWFISPAMFTMVIGMRVSKKDKAL